MLTAQFRQAQLERNMAAARDVLEGQVFNAARAAGRATTLEQAVSYAPDELVVKGGGDDDRSVKAT